MQLIVVLQAKDFGDVFAKHLRLNQSNTIIKLQPGGKRTNHYGLILLGAIKAVIGKHVSVKIFGMDLRNALVARRNVIHISIHAYCAEQHKTNSEEIVAPVPSQKRPDCQGATSHRFSVSHRRSYLLISQY